MKKLIAMSLALGLAAFVSAPAGADEGLQVGDRVGAYYVVDVTGPSQGEKLCYRCQFGNAPVVNIFTRSVDPAVTQLISAVEGEVAHNNEVKGFVTLLADQTDANKEQLQKLASDKSVKSLPLTISSDGTMGPSNYKLGEEDVTVLLWKEGKVVAKHTFATKGLDKAAIDKVTTEVRSKLGS